MLGTDLAVFVAPDLESLDVEELVEEVEEAGDGGSDAEVPARNG